MECLTEVALFRPGGAISSRASLAEGHWFGVLSGQMTISCSTTHIPRADPCRNRVPATVYLLGPTTFPYSVSVSVRHGESLFARHALFSELKGPIGFALMRDRECHHWHAIFINGIHAYYS